MGDQNQYIWGTRHLGLFRPPCLEVGSLQAGYTVSFRGLLPGSPGSYLGVDMRPGDGVDRVIDLSGDFPRIAEELPLRFATIFCLSVLEHCRQPFRMAENLARLLRDDGVIYLSVPFVWEIHDHPRDYWRFAPEGIRELFPGIDFDVSACCYHSQDAGVFLPLADGPPRLGRALNRASRSRGPFYGLAARCLKKTGIAHRLFPYDYLFPPVQLNMIGRKRCPR
jgi:SAM-dependent methyltransferase